VHDDACDAWVLGTGAQDRAQALAALEAPDFALPDLDGRTHRLSDYRGRKVLLATWASGEGVAPTCPCGRQCSTNFMPRASYARFMGYRSKTSTPAATWRAPARCGAPPA
jgi:hypothetical protein